MATDLVTTTAWPPPFHRPRFQHEFSNEEGEVYEYINQPKQRHQGKNHPGID